MLKQPSKWILFPGVLCLLIGISFPTSKLYHQALALLFWVPAFFLIWTCRFEVRPALNSMLGIALLGFVAWSITSLVWSPAEDPVREIKHVIYVVLSLWGFRILGLYPAEHIEKVLIVAAYYMAFIAVIFWLKKYILDGANLHKRLAGFWQLDHSILAAHVFGFFTVVLYQLKPLRKMELYAWTCALFALVSYLLFAQSKGVWLALIAVVLMAPIWRRERIYLVCSVVCMICVLGVLFWVPEFALQRGLSRRPELLYEGLDLLFNNNPLVGSGLGSAVKLQIASVAAPFDHPHNIFLAIALRFGLIGLMLWLAAWIALARLAWQEQSGRIGSVLLGVWLFASIALLSDGDGPWVKPQEVWFLTWIPFGLALALDRLVDKRKHFVSNAVG